MLSSARQRPVAQSCTRSSLLRNLVFQVGDNNRSVGQDSCKNTVSGLDLLDALEPLLHNNCRQSSPHLPKSQPIRRCKSMCRNLDLLHTFQLLLHHASVAAVSSVTPGNNRSICQDSCKSHSGGLDLLHAFQPILHSTTVATQVPIPR